MHLRPGIPTVEQLNTLLADPFYKRHATFNQAFLQQHGKALARYGIHWGGDPLKLWSRRWEYPFCGRQVLDHAAEHPDTPLHLLDAGSGVTFFPYLMLEEVPELHATCCDSNPAYDKLFAEVNRQRDCDRVTFTHAMLQDMPVETDSVDVLACISVLEHTDQYDAILAEFARVLKPGGTLALTFDLSLDGRFKLSHDQARAVVESIQSHFDPAGDVDYFAELERMDHPEGLLSTDYIKRTDPDLLPWKMPWLLGLRDLLTGHGWTGGFKSKSVLCVSARARVAEPVATGASKG